MKWSHVGELDDHAVELLRFVFPFAVRQKLDDVRMIEFFQLVHLENEHINKAKYFLYINFPKHRFRETKNSNYLFEKVFGHVLVRFKDLYGGNLILVADFSHLSVRADAEIRKLYNFIFFK